MMIRDLDFKEIIALHGRSTASVVSVVIPLYNYEHYIVDTLGSICQQTLADLELIVVDDCSRDNSLEAASCWLKGNAARFGRSILVQNSTNSGLPYTRNVGFSLATGEFVFPIDADNQIYPRCLQRCLEVIQHHAAAVAYTIVERFGASSGLMNLHPWNRETFRYGNHVDAMALIRRTAWAEVGGYDPAFRLGWEDYEFWLRLCDAGYSGVQVPEILGRYRTHPESMTKQITSKADALMQLANMIEARYPWADVRPAVRSYIENARAGIQ